MALEEERLILELNQARF